MTLVAVAQFAPTDDKGANLDEIERLARIAVARGARMAVFPEYSSWFVNPLDDRCAANAEPLDGPFTARLRELATELDITIVAGLVEQGSATRVRNAVVAVDATGILAVYRKQHLYDAFGQRESEWIEPGAIGEPQTFVLDGLTFGMMTCYDLRFPEVARMLADADADAAVVPAEWVRGPLKEHHWSTLLTARAIENTMYVIAADHPAPIGVGASAIIDPQGVSIARLAVDTDVAVAEVDPAKIATTRRENPALSLRRYRVLPEA
ncbi:MULTISPECIES: carbon-nitrogen hydrolase family protein [unclassified Microbacterium]|uniref:carbon-nitrogen hydrolase family protein n=1 Tax=unclassified Microbacterium TaxID=2609290 RepID=UPI00097F3A73|nr:carbon-nitrogen hydrolase family protein [Microbacterium sp. JB110]RCS62024.1 carbon-nitrogen hydrolase family protein [Microbacterium sp. JB110]SJM44197.1 Predicted amidohydrolase [Frigoribacterium sp. JB110]